MSGIVKDNWNNIHNNIRVRFKLFYFQISTILRLILRETVLIYFNLLLNLI